MKEGGRTLDLTYLGDLSILAGTGLVVGEYLSNRRISLFEC